MDDKKKKKYVIPEAEVINFNNEDIITLSAGTNNAEWGGAGDDNYENW